MFTEKIPKLQLARRLADFSKKWDKLTQDQEVLSVFKDCVIPFLKVPVQRTIQKQLKMFKTQKLLIDQDIIQMPDKGAIKKSETSFSRSFSEQYSPCKNESVGKRPITNLKALN